MFSSGLYLFLKFLKRMQFRFRLTIFGTLILLFLMFEFNNYLEWSKGITYSINYVNRNLQNQLGADAVLIGPYAQTITLGNRLKSEIYYFGAYPENDRLFDIIPATHVVFESGSGSSLSGNERSFNKYYPSIREKAILIDSYLIGRYYVNIYNICAGTNNTFAKSYRMSNFETAMTFYHEGEIDSALIFFKRALEFDQVRRALLYMAEIHLKLGDTRQAKAEFEKGLMDDCYDPRIWALYSVSCSKTGDLETSQYARKKAATYAHSQSIIKESNP
jgi:tetratricopeptide (TPR) repeat protein